MTLLAGRSILSHVIVLGALTFATEAPPVNSPEVRALDAFGARVKEYTVLHKKLESSLPKLPKRHTPEEVDMRQRALASLISSARPDAKPGDFFTPDIQALAKRIVSGALSGPDGKTLKASMMDENPGVPKLTIHQRFPSSLPLSTMPPPVLASLPKLPKELEYRFVGPRLILLDIEADIVIDFTDEILPE